MRVVRPVEAQAAVLTDVRHAQVHGDDVGFDVVPDAPTFEQDPVLPCCAQWARRRKGEPEQAVTDRMQSHRITLWHCYYLLGGPDGGGDTLIAEAASASAAIAIWRRHFPSWSVEEAGQAYLAGLSTERVPLYVKAGLSAQEVLAVELAEGGPSPDRIAEIEMLAAMRRNTDGSAA